MCDDHSGVLVEIPTARDRDDCGRMSGVDACIAPLVEALNAVGMATVASCCGHGHRPGTIALSDGREIIIAPDYATARKFDALFPVTAYGEERVPVWPFALNHVVQLVPPDDTERRCLWPPKEV